MPGLLFFSPQRLAIVISEASARLGPVSTAATSGQSGPQAEMTIACSNGEAGMWQT